MRFFKGLKIIKYRLVYVKRNEKVCVPTRWRHENVRFYCTCFTRRVRSSRSKIKALLVWIVIIIIFALGTYSIVQLQEGRSQRTEVTFLPLLRWWRFDERQRLRWTQRNFAARLLGQQAFIYTHQNNMYHSNRLNDKIYRTSLLIREDRKELALIRDELPQHIFSKQNIKSWTSYRSLVSLNIKLNKKAIWYKLNKEMYMSNFKKNADKYQIARNNSRQ